MKIPVRCPNCSAKGSMDEAYVGKAISCPVCRSGFIMPGAVENCSTEGAAVSDERVPVAADVTNTHMSDVSVNSVETETSAVIDDDVNTDVDEVAEGDIDTDNDETTDSSIELEQVTGPKYMELSSTFVGTVNCIAFSPDGTLLIAGLDDTHQVSRRGAYAWQVPSEFQSNKWVEPSVVMNAGDSCTVSILALSPDGNLLATCDGTDHFIGRGTVNLWDLPTGCLIQSFLLPADSWCDDLLITPDGKTLVAACNDGKIRRWNLEDLKPLRTIQAYAPDEDEEAETGPLAITADGKLLACGGEEGVQLCDMAKGKVVVQIDESRHRLQFLMTSDSKLLVTAPTCETYDDDMDTVGIWHIPSGELAGQVEGHDEEVRCAAVTPDGQLLITGDSSCVRIWQLPDGKLVRAMEQSSDFFGVSALAVSPDCKYVASGTDFNNTEVRIWALPSGEEAGLIPITEDEECAANCIAFSPDGRYIAVAGTFIRLYEVSSLLTAT